MSEAQAAGTNSALHDWTIFAARAIKLLAPHQLVSSGGEGFYSPINSGGVEAAAAKNPQPSGAPLRFALEGTQFVGTGVVDAIDLLSYHLHPDEWLPGASDAETNEFMLR